MASASDGPASPALSFSWSSSPFQAKVFIDVKHAPFLEQIDKLTAYREKRERFEKTKFSDEHGVSYEIFGLVAFLFATALSILKTTLELYGLPDQGRGGHIGRADLRISG